jgi:peptidoglycan/xylan/chitin deacetylase (PgdA/CDA1 family)
MVDMTARWALKRTLKWILECGMAFSGVGFLYRKSSLFRSGFRILTYHRVIDHPLTSHDLKTEHFRLHMAYLSDHHPVLGLSELVERLMQGPLPEPGSVAVTFDDGYRDAADTVATILNRYHIPATFFVIAGLLDANRRMNTKLGYFMTWDDARDLVSAGLTVGSHTVTHRSLGGIPLKEVEQELLISRKRIAEELGALPQELSYPYGTVLDVSEDIAAAARRAGYRCAVTAIHGLNRAACNPFLLGRTTLTAGDGPRTFKMILSGCLDPWVFVDRWGYRFQRQRGGGLIPPFNVGTTG